MATGEVGIIYGLDDAGDPLLLNAKGKRSEESYLRRYVQLQEKRHLEVARAGLAAHSPAELRPLLTFLGLSSKGSKSQLIERLTLDAHYASGSASGRSSTTPLQDREQALEEARVERREEGERGGRGRRDGGEDAGRGRDTDTSSRGDTAPAGAAAGAAAAQPGGGGGADA